MKNIELLSDFNSNAKSMYFFERRIPFTSVDYGSFKIILSGLSDLNLSSLFNKDILILNNMIFKELLCNPDGEIDELFLTILLQEYSQSAWGIKVKILYKGEY